MEKIAWVIGACAVLSAVSAAPAAAQTVVYKAALGGSAEAPPVSTAGNGTASVNADFGTKQLSWQVAYAGLSGPPVGAHIHCGAPSGANAPIAVPLGTPPNLAKSDPRLRRDDRCPAAAAPLGSVLCQYPHRNEQTG